MNAALQQSSARPRSGIATLAAGLAQSRERIETAFVGVGASLSDSAGLLNRITQTFATLPADLASPELTEATARLSAVGTRAEEISASFAAEQSDIARLVAVVTAADHPISDLRRAVKMMGIVAINARVVAASVVGDDHDFDVFTTDIAVLSNDATKAIEAFSQVYAQLTAEVHRAAQQREQFEASHRDTLSGLAQGLNAHLADIVARRQASAEGSAETGRVVRQITERVASAVMAMQVGDSTRQRLEHIEAALAELDATVDAEIVADIAGLEAAQLAAAAQSFDAETAEAEGALTQLAQDATVVTARSRDVYGERGGQSSLSAFSAEVRNATAVLHNCETARHKLEEVASAVQATVKVLLEHVEAVREIEANMRLVSLNAAVRCAQLGPRGRALNVIARQLRELTGEIVVAAEQAMTSLGEAASLAQSFSAASTGEAAGQVAWLEREAASAVKLLETVDQRLSEALAVLGKAGPAAIAKLSEAASRLAGHAGISEGMADTRLSLEALAGPPRRPLAASLPLLAKLRKTYTMEAERKIHRARIPDEAAAAPDPEPALDDLLF